MLMLVELKGWVRWFTYFLDLLYVRYNRAKFHHCRICVTDFREEAFRKHLGRLEHILNNLLNLCCYYYRNSYVVFCLGLTFLLLKYGGSLLSHTVNSYETKLLRILRIVILRIFAFSLTLVFKVTLCLSNPQNARLMSSILASFWCHTSHSSHLPPSTLFHNQFDDCNLVWWWQFERREEWTPDSDIKFDCNVNLRSIQEEEISNIESSRPEVFCKNGALRNFSKFTGKHLCQSLFFNKVAGIKPEACNSIKKETLAQVFSCEFCEISKNTFFI